MTAADGLGETAAHSGLGGETTADSAFGGFEDSVQLWTFDAEPPRMRPYMDWMQQRMRADTGGHFENDSADGSGAGGASPPVAWRLRDINFVHAGEYLEPELPDTAEEMARDTLGRVLLMAAACGAAAYAVVVVMRSGRRGARGGSGRPPPPLQGKGGGAEGEGGGLGGGQFQVATGGHNQWRGDV